jgi:hypothetical protein
MAEEKYKRVGLVANTSRDDSLIEAGTLDPERAWARRRAVVVARPPTTERRAEESGSAPRMRRAGRGRRVQPEGSEDAVHEIRGARFVVGASARTTSSRLYSGLRGSSAIGEGEGLGGGAAVGVCRGRAAELLLPTSKSSRGKWQVGPTCSHPKSKIEAMTVGPALQSLKGLDRHFTCPVAHVKAPKR